MIKVLRITAAVYNIFVIVTFAYDKLNRIVNNSKRLSELQERIEKLLRGDK